MHCILKCGCRFCETLQACFTASSHLWSTVHCLLPPMTLFRACALNNSKFWVLRFALLWAWMSGSSSLFHCRINKWRSRTELRARTRASAMRGRLPTAWAMTRPNSRISTPVRHWFNWLRVVSCGEVLWTQLISFSRSALLHEVRLVHLASRSSRFEPQIKIPLCMH
jgi:hypothetical protein